MVVGLDFVVVRRLRGSGGLLGARRGYAGVGVSCAMRWLSWPYVFEGLSWRKGRMVGFGGGWEWSGCLDRQAATSPEQFGSQVGEPMNATVSFNLVVFGKVRFESRCTNSQKVP